MSANTLPSALLIIFAAFTIGGVRAIQSTTALLRIAMALVLADEDLARKLLLVRAVPTC